MGITYKPDPTRKPAPGGIGPSPAATPEPAPTQPTNQQPDRDWGYKPGQDTQPQQNTDQSQQASPTNVGHDGAFNGLNREQWRDSWMSSGNKSQQGTDAWLKNMGATKLAGNGTFMTPFGEVMDLGQNYRTGNVTPAWTSVQGGMGPSSYPSYNDDQSGGYGSPYGQEWGGGWGGGGYGNPYGQQGGMNQQMDPDMMSAFQQFLASRGGNNQETMAKMQTGRYARNRPNRNPYSATQTRM